MKIYISRDLKNRFYLGGGVFYHWLSVDDGAVRANVDYTWEEPEITWSVEGNESFGGIGGSISIGMEVFLNKLSSLRLEFGRRFGFYSAVRDKWHEGFQRIEKLSATGWIFSGGILFAVF